MCPPGVLTWGFGGCSVGVLGVFWRVFRGVQGVFWGCSGGILGVLELRHLKVSIRTGLEHHLHFLNWETTLYSARWVPSRGRRTARRSN